MSNIKSRVLKLAIVKNVKEGCILCILTYNIKLQEFFFMTFEVNLSVIKAIGSGIFLLYKKTRDTIKNNN